MSKLKVCNMQGKEVSEIEVSDKILETGRGKQAVHDVVVNDLARRRAGTASTLSKGKVSGSGRKPWRQKGTGRARAGYRQSPVWRGGAVAFGPHPRKYGGKINRKVARLGFERAFAEKAAAGGIVVLDELSMAEPRTKAFVELLKTLQLSTPALLLVKEVDRNVGLSARNIAGLEIARASDVSVYQLLRYPNVIVTVDGLEILKNRINGGAGESK